MFLLFLCADLLSAVAWFTQLNSAVSVCRSVVPCCLVNMTDVSAVSVVSVCRSVVPCCLVYKTELCCFYCFCVQNCCLLLLGLHH